MPTDSPRLRLCAVLGVVLLAGCSVSAPPAVQGSETTSSTTPPPPKKEQIVVGIDSIGAGFNPHLLSDQSPVNSAISALVLPSAFRPVPDSATTTGSRWEMDPTLLVSAEETSQEPFTVTYTIRPEAQWTDNAPIGADDFSYLWQQMLTQPGTVDPAGYGNITDVQSRDGGKRVVVTFDHKYPAWRELFNDLLPAHIVKDIPGGFASGLVKSMPASGGVSASTPSTRSVTRSCWRVMTGTGQPRPFPTRSFSVEQAPRRCWPIRSATGTPKWPRCTAAA